MGKIKTYFFDSYAFFEIIEGNSEYDKYAIDVAIITTKLNLMELHYGLLRKYGKKTADLYYDTFRRFTIEITDLVIKKANELKFNLKKRKLSYIDCIGYTLAKTRKIEFLTGDKEFEDMENVKFVK